MKTYVGIVNHLVLVDTLLASSPAAIPVPVSVPVAPLSIPGLGSTPSSFALPVSVSTPASPPLRPQRLVIALNLDNGNIGVVGVFPGTAISPVSVTAVPVTRSASLGSSFSAPFSAPIRTNINIENRTDTIY